MAATSVFPAPIRRLPPSHETLRESLRLVQAREAEQAAKLAALREVIAVEIA